MKEKTRQVIFSVVGGISLSLGMLFNMVISIILAIGAKPMIYKLNSPLGEGYAIFASYVVAIVLYSLMPKWLADDTGKEQ